MRASEFEFDLPDDLIAQYPVEPRDCARLMVVDRRSGTWEHRIFAELPELLYPSRYPRPEYHTGCTGSTLGSPCGNRWEMGRPIPSRATRWIVASPRKNARSSGNW